MPDLLTTQIAGSTEAIRTSSTHFVVIVLVLTTLAPSVVAREPEEEVVQEPYEKTGGIAWRWGNGRVSFRLGQLLPDFVFGYFLARGFDEQSARLIADHCVFFSKLRNQSPSTQIDINLLDWQAIGHDKRYAMRVSEDWQSDWVRLKPPKPARLAFKWSLFPTRQIFQKDDWGMGMMMFPLPPKAKFDLHIRWREDGEDFSKVFNNMHCASNFPANTGARP